MSARDKIADILENMPENMNGWEDAADAILAALPDMIAPLVWDKGIVDWAGLKQGGRYVACSTFPEGSWAWWLDGDDESQDVCENEQAAKAAANAHHRAAIMAAFNGEPKP
jgi:hypothetical protein